MTKIYIYRGGLKIVEKSGVGSAIHHQEQILRRMGASLTENWKEADVVHINTVFPDSFLAACAAKLEKKQVVYYGHSTREDFRNSFIGSDFAAPFFQWWICRCYNRGDVILTPTAYSRRLLEKYGIRKPVYALTNGVDTDFFHEDGGEKAYLHERYQIPEEKKIVISAGHMIRRKGIMEFLSLAASMPEAVFIWFGGGNWWAVPGEIKRAVRNKPENVIFAGFVEPCELRAAYCGADAFVFLSHEETEGIVVLEALACKIPVVVRNIPVYRDWILENVHVLKASGTDSFRHKLRQIFSGDCSAMTERGRRLAEEHSLFRTGMLMREIYRKAGIGSGESGSSVRKVPMK